MRHFDIPLKTYAAAVDHYKRLTNKQRLAVFFIALVFFLSIAGAVHYLQARAFSGGSGTIDNPYLITTCVELQDIGNNEANLQANYLLANDIDCSSISNFTPIGDMNKAWYERGLLFVGRFEGGGHTISNLLINYPNNKYVGLFAQTDGVAIKNVKLTNASVTGGEYVGSVVGTAYRSALVGITVTNSTIINTSLVSGSNAAGGVVGFALQHGAMYEINVTNTLVSNQSTVDDSTVRSLGGIVGWLNSGVLANSFSSATTTSTTWPVGGVVGQASYATISNTYSTGRVTGTLVIGGIVGIADQAGVVIRDSYFNGVATTSQWATPANIGGIMGEDQSNFFLYPGSSLINTFAVGVVSSTTHSGGILGGITHISTPVGAIYSNNYFYPTGTTQTTCSGQGTSFLVSECTSDNTSSHYNSNTFAPESSWDFVHMWQNVASTRPSLRLLPYAAPSFATSIGSCAALVSAILTNPDGWYALSGNIDCAGNPNLIPISYFRPDAYFTGTLDGNGYTISGVNISTTTTTNNIGLFGTLAGAYIKNLILAGSGVSARFSNAVGALAGVAFATSLNGIYSSVPVDGGRDNVGGLVGEEVHYVGSSHVSANITGTYNGSALDGDSVGGLIGRSQERLVIENSSFINGSVTGQNTVGGLTAYLHGDIRTSSSTGTIIGESSFGGLVGSIGDNYSTSTISNSTFAGTVTGNSAVSTYHIAAGGIAGGATNTFLSNVSSSGTLTFPTSSGLNKIGGIVGGIGDNSPGNAGINNATFTGTITAVNTVDASSGYYDIGGIAGAANFNGTVANVFASTSMTFASQAVPTSGTVGTIGGLFGTIYVDIFSTSTSNGSIKIYGDSSSAYISEIGGVSGFGAYRIGNVHSSTTIEIVANEIYGVGGLLGDARAYISNSSASGAITISAPTQSYVGGLVGDYFGSFSETYSAYKVYSTGSITLTGGQGGTAQVSQVGGLFGEAFREILIQNVYASSTINIISSVTSAIGAYQIGGLIGYVDSGVVIVNGYSSGFVQFNSSTGATSDKTGGAIGFSDDSAGANTFSNMFSASPVSAGVGATNVGGFIGSYGITDFLTNIEYDIFRTNQALCTGTDNPNPSWCTSKNVSNATPTYFYSHLNTPQSSWDFADIWLEHDNTYPTFGMSVFPSTPPSVTSGSATGISATGALANGNLTSVGTSVVTEEGFVYGPTISYIATSSAFSGAFSTGSFSAALSGLAPNTTYHFSAYARSSAGTTYGSDQTFTTAVAAVTTPPTSTSGRSGSVVHDIITSLIPGIFEPTQPTIVIQDVPPPSTPPSKPRPPSTTPRTQPAETAVISKVPPVVQSNPLPAVSTPPPRVPLSEAHDEQPGLLARATQELLALMDYIASSGSSLQSLLKIVVSLNAVAIVVRFGYVLLSGIRTTADVPLLILRNLSTFFTLGFIRRRKNEKWGTVYDSKTLRPLDPAVVTLFDESGKVVKTQITDLDGRFGFFVQPGIYSLTAQKGHHSFPAHTDPVLDPLYQEHYYGAPIVMTEAGTLIKDIPLDPTDFDWNEQEKYKKGLYRFYSRLDRPLAYASLLLTIAGAVFAVVSVVVDPEPFNYFLLAIYTIVGLYYLVVGAPRLYGRVNYATQSIPNALIRARLPGNTSGGPHTVTDHLGRYYLLLPPGEMFNVSVEQKLPDDTYSTVWQGEMHPERGYLNKDISIV